MSQNERAPRMSRIGCTNNSGLRSTQCQYPDMAHSLALPCMQSTISIEPMIAEHGEGQIMRGTKSRLSMPAAECMSMRPRKEVRHDRFSTSFCPEHIRYAQGFFIVIAFIRQFYTIWYFLSRRKTTYVYI